LTQHLSFDFAGASWRVVYASTSKKLTPLLRNQPRTLRSRDQRRGTADALCLVMRGYITEADFDQCEAEFPGIVEFYGRLRQKPGTFLELVHEFIARCDELRTGKAANVGVPLLGESTLRRAQNS
jgi:hypothetical protein